MSRPEPSFSRVHERVLVLVRGTREGQLTSDLLRRNGFDACLCQDITEVCARTQEGAGAALLAEELLTKDALKQLEALLLVQPPWSDFPLVVFSAPGALGPVGGISERANVVYLDRPVRVRSMLAAMHAAIRSRRRQYEARRAIDSRDAFLAMLGHELRNPLGATRLAITMMEKKIPEVVGAKEYGVIDRQTRHLARLVDDLLDVARITHGKVVLKRERLNLVPVVRAVYDTLEGRAREERLSFDLDVHDASLWIEGDRQRLEQVFTNLVTNAIKYTPRGGGIRITVRADGEEAVVAVTDTGIGLAPDMIDRVFEVFTQADSSLDRAQGGMGLGLALVRSVVHLHGGTVRVASEGLGQGTEFVVRFRRLLASGAVRAPSKPMEVPAAGKRIVVVEDSADIRDLLSDLLRTTGHDVDSAEDGPRGLAAILTQAPDLAFVDLGLPGFDGLELARRARSSGSRAYLIALTGYGQFDDKRRAVDAGFDDHLTKPVVQADLERAIVRAERARAAIANRDIAS